MTLAVLLAAMTTQLFAQQRNTDNLWRNPSFEDANGAKTGWHFGSQIWTQEDTSNPKDGAKAISMYVSFGGMISSLSTDGALAKYAIEGADAFNLTYWYRGKIKKPNLGVVVRYYTSAAADMHSFELDVPSSAVQPTSNDQWVQKEVVIPTTIPSGAAVSHIVVMLNLKADTRDTGSIVIDHFSLNRVYNKPAIVVNKPDGLKATAYQREAELTWEGSIDPEVSWEIEHNGKKIQTKTPSYLLTGLEPQREYNIKVVAKKEDVTSDAAELKVSTQSPYRSKDDEERIPYLRTITRSEGQVRKTINLFYNDLYNGNAKITYYFDGVEIKPTGYQLTFPATGKHTLKVHIEESASEVWTLNYNLNINE